MSNIRIKDIATTAASTASDDFIAIDGATNGTRKLDIYNPTIGGNLTVSGTGTSTIASTLSVNGITGLGKLNVRTETNGNLHCRPYSLLNGSGAGVALDSLNDLGSGINGLYIRGNPIKLAFGNVIVVDGNTLLGTSTDSSNGKLQLATHTTSAGGIGFGTDVALFRANANGLQLNSTTLQTSLYLSESGTQRLQICTNNAGGQITVMGNNSLTLQTNFTTALTLDSSQNATFAGVLKAPAGSATSPSHTFSGDTSSGIYSLGTKKLGVAVNANIAVAVQADVDGSTGPTVYVKDLATAPTVNPSGGGYLFSQNGALKWRGSSGTVTTIAAA